VSGLLLALSVAGCSSKYWRRSADKEAARLIQEKVPAVPNMDTNFTAEAKAALRLEDLGLAPEPGEFLGAEAAAERGARVLDLATALELSVHQSREFQTRREMLYLEALDLSLARWRLQPIFGARANAALQSTTPVRVTGQDPITGETVTAIRNGSKLATGRGLFGVDWLLATGARLSADFTADFLRFVGGNGTPNTGSRLGGTLTQPLLRGAGFKVNRENLKQAERDLLYAMREFAQYRQSFTVTTAGDYFQVLQARDTARNAFLDLQRSRQNVARERAFADEGQRPLASLDQFRQAELNSETRWLEALRSYREALDRLKISLGVPLETKLVLADSELAALTINEPGVPVEEAVPVAVATRLDLQTARERLEDSQRRVPVSKNNLLPQVDAFAAAGFASTTTNGFVLPDPKFNNWSAGLTVDLGLDRKAQRNDFRRTLIQVEQTKRQFALAVDTVRLQIATDWRALEQARRNFENTEIGVKLAERRVEEQELRMQLGRGQTRDLLDAQSDLNSARNGRTAALVNHTLARLRYWRDMGLLFVRDDGSWYEAPVPPVAGPDRETKAQP
jgi:outer membrane protein TolC